MSDLVGNPEDRFSHVAAQIIVCSVIGSSKTRCTNSEPVQLYVTRQGKSS